MNWGDPVFAWLALLALPALVLMRHAKARRKQLLAKLVGWADAESVYGRIRTWPVVACHMLAFVLVVAALCRPQWGGLERQERHEGLDILVAVDVSRSMLADDVPPNRLALAKKAVAALPGFLRGDRVGLVAFAGSAFLVCPLTTDYDTFSQAVAELSPDVLPVGGSSLAAAVKEAVRGFGAGAGGEKILIVVGDGEDHDGGEAAVRAARASGMRVFTFLTGTATGGLLPLPGGAFHRDRAGAIVSSKANPGSMRALSAATGGASFDLSVDAGALESLYRSRLADFEGRAHTRVAPLLEERFQIPLGVALLLVVAAPFLSLMMRRGGS